MNAFFRSGRFKILLAILIVLSAFTIRAIVSNGFSPLVAQIAQVITTPFQSFSAFLSSQVEDTLGVFLHAQETAEELERTKELLREANEQLIDMEHYKSENEQYREMLNIREENEDLTIQPASVIARDHSDRFGSFVIDKGSYHGITPRSPVITADGLVGIISEVGLTQSKVTTILDVRLNIGAVDVRSQDTGVVSGTVELAAQGYCQLSYLPRDSGVAVGDLVRTSGSDSGGPFPRDLAIGNVVEVVQDPSGLSLNAVIQPAADVMEVNDVFVVTSFLGMGEEPLGSGEEDASSSSDPSQDGSSSQDPAEGDAAPASSSQEASSSEASSQEESSSSIEEPSSQEVSSQGDAPASSEEASSQETGG